LEFPIRWLYTRPGLPVRILEEYDVWRLIEDPDGDQGWTHSSLLSTQRTMMVRASGVQSVHRLADTESRVVARAEPGAIGELLNCDQTWCRVEIGGRRGWLPRSMVWGVLDYEWRS
jgi:SH3-like domain-containing protein